MIRVSDKIGLKVIFFACFAIFFSFLFASNAQAVTLIPPSLEIGLTPGQDYKTAIKLYNETADELQLYTETVAFTAKGESGQPDFDFDATEEVGLTAWVDVEEGPIVIEPGERREVKVVISPPTNADPGGHYATLFFSSAPPEEGMVRIASKVGTLILAMVEGEVKEDGEIKEFSTVGDKTWFNHLPIEFFARFNNTGNVHLKPTGEIVIENLFGKQTDAIEFNPGLGATLPNQIRKYTATWEKKPVIEKPGNFWSDFWQGYSNETDNFAFGRYTASLNILTGSGNSISKSANLNFWVFPWRIIVVWGLVVILGIILLIWALKKYNAWIIKKSSK